MMEEALCEKCRYYRAPFSRDHGTCHRRAPSPFQNHHLMALKLLADIHWRLFRGEETNFSEGMEFESLQPEQTNWPTVDSDDSCGEFTAAP